MARRAGSGGREGRLPRTRRGDGPHEAVDPGRRGHESSGPTREDLGRRRTLEHLDASEDALLTVGTESETLGQEIEEAVGVFPELGAHLADRALVVEGLPAGGEQSSAEAVGQEAVVADADKALGEDVEQEAADELVKGKRQGSRPTAAVVFETEGDAGVVDVKQSVVRDRDAVGVAGEILQNRLGGLEGWLGVHDPLGAIGFTEELLEGRRLPTGGEPAV